MPSSDSVDGAPSGQHETTAARDAPAARRPLARTAIPVALGLLPVAMGLATGSYFATTWLAVAIAIGAVTVVVRLAAGTGFAGFRQALPPTAWIATALLGSLTVVTLLSAAWASDKGAALEEGTRTTFYFLLFMAALGGIETARQARLFTTAYALAAAAVALGVIVALSASVTPQDFFSEIKLSKPIGYSNAEGSFFLMPALLAVHLASRRSTRTALRPVLMVAGLVLLQAGVLTQSRGALWAAIGALIVYFVVVPGRPRALLWWGVTLAVLAVTFPYLNALQIDLGDQDYAALSTSVHEMVRAVVASLLAIAVFGALLTWLDTRIKMPRAGVWIGRALAVVAVIMVLVALVDRFPQLEDPIDAGRSAWTTFKGEEPTSRPASTIRLLDMRGAYRYQLWQVAWTTYTEHPALGIGADNYSIEWVRLRPFLKDVRQPHNVYLRLLAETGLVGFLLFAGGVAIVFGGALARAFGRRGPGRSLIAAMLATAALFLIHASVEWVWHVPAGAAAFFLLLGALAGTPSAAARGRARAALDGAADQPSTPGVRLRGRRIRLPYPLTMAAAAGCAILVLTVPQVLSLRLTDQATSLFALAQYDRAVSAASWASRANPLAEEPLVLKGRALARQGDVNGSEAAFTEAVDKNPRAWLTYARWGRTREELGLDPVPAYRQAARLNPLAPDLQEYVETD